MQLFVTKFNRLAGYDTFATTALDTDATGTSLTIVAIKLVTLRLVKEAQNYSTLYSLMFFLIVSLVT